MDDKKIRVTLVKSTNAARRSIAPRCAAWGLRRLRQTVELKDTPQVRGMINSVTLPGARRG